MKGFTLVPVVLALTVVGAVAFLLNRDSGINARMITQQADTERARYAAEAGLQAANYVVQQAGCSGTYPTAAAPVARTWNGANFTAYSTTATGSPLTLVATGTFNGASVTLTRSNVYVYKPRQTNIVQPGASGQDTHVHPGFPDRNYGGELNLRLETGRFQPLIKFDLSSFPAGTRVVPWYDAASGTLKAGATLSLYQSVGGSSTAGAFVNANLVTRGWVEGTQTGSTPPSGATWNSYDGVGAWPVPGRGYAEPPVARLAHTTSLGWKEWDITAAAAAWLEGVHPNYGLWLTDSGSNIGDTYYVASENSTAAQRPKLTLSAQQPCGAGTTYIEMSVDGYVRGGSDANRNFGGAPFLYVNSGNPERRLILRYDTGSIPPGSVVKSALLRLYCRQVLSPTNQQKRLNLYYVMEPWSEGTLNGTGTADGATWNSRDGVANWQVAGVYYYTSTVLAVGREEAGGSQPLPGGFRAGWVTFDLTSMTQSWVDGVYGNQGLLMRSESSSDVFEFDSRANTGGTAPQLVVVWQ